MYIKAVTLHGFKSYKDPVTIELSPHCNVVVGRNGAGKSNFFAAIRFVLGDIFTNMRSDERQALLHEGAGLAVMSSYVELVFDNQDNRFPVRTATPRRHMPPLPPRPPPACPLPPDSVPASRPLHPLVVRPVSPCVPLCPPSAPVGLRRPPSAPVLAICLRNLSALPPLLHSFLPRCNGARAHTCRSIATRLSSAAASD
jgi:hypothetical protein